MLFTAVNAVLDHSCAGPEVVLRAAALGALGGEDAVLGSVLLYSLASVTCQQKCVYLLLQLVGSNGHAVEQQT